MHLYYFGSGSNVPAISRKILEAELIEKHHWLPQDIAKIPYKKLQEYRTIMAQKSVAISSKAQVKNFKQQYQTQGRGQTKRMVREI